VQETVKKEEPAAKEQQLIYRVQVGVFRNPLAKEKLNALEELAGWDHVVIRTKNNQGYYIYAIGNFATFDEAKKFRNKLAERGMSGCFVTAYKNGARILIGEGSGK
jgi:cell division protein FtsN